MGNLLVLIGIALAVVVLGWWIGRHDRDVDSHHEREYREPPVFHTPDSHGGGL